MRVIARGIITAEVVDFAWTDHNGVATKYHNLDPDLGVYGVFDYLDAEGIKGAEVILSMRGGGTYFYRVEAADSVE